MYWSDWGASPHISVSYMDGKSRKVLIEENIGWPNGLTIDYPSKRLYWVDAKLKVIESILLDGRDRRVRKVVTINLSLYRTDPNLPFNFFSVNSFTKFTK